MNHFKLLKDYVFEYLSDKIYHGSLRPGEKIDISQICDHLKMSPTPVREALTELAYEAYIERLPRRGFVVKEITPEKVKQIYEIIGCLEGLATETVIYKITKENIVTLEGMIEEMEVSIEKSLFRKFYKLQRNFHDFYISIGGNEEIRNILNSLKNRLMRQAYSKDNEDGQPFYNALKQFNNEHRKIIDLLKIGDAQELARYLREVHWAFTYAKLDSDLPKTINSPGLGLKSSQASIEILKEETET